MTWDTRFFSYPVNLYKTPVDVSLKWLRRRRRHLEQNLIRQISNRLKK